MSIKIMLDAGHAGKYNQAPLVPEYYESDMTWKLQNYMLEEFKAYKNVEVLTTRNSQDVDVEVYARGKSAEGCDIFISLHSNATGGAALTVGDKNEKVNRVDVYCPYDKRNDSHVIGKQLATEIAKLMNVSGGSVKTRKSENGDWEYYGVLRGACDAGVPVYMIIEHSFHTNAAAARWLLDNNNLKKLAKLEVEILADWFSLEKKTVNESVEPSTNEDYVVYVVQNGDTLSGIANKFDTTWQEIAKLNNIEDPNKIYGGQKLKIPQKIEVKPEPEAKPERTYKFNVNDIVNFKGTKHYGNANAADGATCKSGKAKVTSRFDGKHPYHLIAEKDGKSNVYGWVNEEDIEAWKEATSTTIKLGDKVKIKQGVKTYANGVAMKSWVLTSTFYVRSIEKNGTIYLISTQKTGNVYTGRVKATDVYKV